MRRRKRKQRTPEKMRRRANRRQRFFGAVGRILFLGVLLVVAILAMTIFFKVENVTVEGATKYSAQEIAAGMEVKQGDNLYLWNKVKVSDALLEKFPYLETVQIRRHLPNALTVTVTECTPAVAVQSGAGYFLLSEQGKVLEQVTNSTGLPTVVGMALSEVSPGQMLSAESSDEAQALLLILQSMDAAGMLKDMDFINLTDLHDIRIGYLDRFDIRIGTVDNLAYHLRFAQTVVNDRLSPSDIGRLYWDDQNRLHFVPDTAENVARSGRASAATTTTVDPETGETVQTGGTDVSAPVDLSGGTGTDTDSSDEQTGESGQSEDGEDTDSDTAEG